MELEKTCPRCGCPMPAQGRGRPRKYCGKTCTADATNAAKREMRTDANGDRKLHELRAVHSVRRLEGILTRLETLEKEFKEFQILYPGVSGQGFVDAADDITDAIEVVRRTPHLMPVPTKPAHYKVDRTKKVIK